jgi:hypothetical protein
MEEEKMHFRWNEKKINYQMNYKEEQGFARDLL